MLFDCLFTLRTTPIEDMKTTKLVLPALMNGNGNPVGGMEPVTTATLRRVWMAITSPTPHESKQPKRSFALRPILKRQTTSAA